MTDGVRDSRRLGYGDHAVWCKSGDGGICDCDAVNRHPECRAICRGSERYRLDTPSAFGRAQDGRKLVYCKCCNHELRLARDGETGLSHGATLALAEGVMSEGRVMVDDICRYDVVVLKELKPA